MGIWYLVFSSTLPSLMSRCAMRRLAWQYCDGRADGVGVQAGRAGGRLSSGWGGAAGASKALAPLPHGC